MDSGKEVSDRFVDPQQVVAQMHISAGMRVADIGAGSGAYVFPIADKVGGDGRVYALDVQRDYLTRIANEAGRTGRNNIEIIWADVERMHGSKLQDSATDVALLSNVLFQFEIKEDALREVYRIVKPGGQAVVIEWSESFGGMGPQTGDVVSKEEATRLMEAAGFKLTREFVPGAHHYGLVYTK